MATQHIDWKVIGASLNEKGYAIIPKVLSQSECEHLAGLYDDVSLYRIVINMQRYRFGKGEYKYYAYPLPGIVQTFREMLYEPLSHIANYWMQILHIDKQFPNQHHQLIKQCNIQNQNRPTPLILRYETNGFNTLHQDLYGEVYFPFQVVFALSEPGKDYTGGEFVLVENIPRAQSRAEVIHINQGDALIFATNFRPVQSAKGYYRATMKHGVSSIRSGVRYALGIIFHDAL